MMQRSGYWLSEAKKGWKRECKRLRSENNRLRSSLDTMSKIRNTRADDQKSIAVLAEECESLVREKGMIPEIDLQFVI